MWIFFGFLELYTFLVQLSANSGEVVSRERERERVRRRVWDNFLVCYEVLPPCISVDGWIGCFTAPETAVPCENNNWMEQFEAIFTNHCHVTSHHDTQCWRKNNEGKPSSWRFYFRFNSVLHRIPNDFTSVWLRFYFGFIFHIYFFGFASLEVLLRIDLLNIWSCTSHDFPDLKVKGGAQGERGRKTERKKGEWNREGGRQQRLLVEIKSLWLRERAGFPYSC